MTDVQDTIVFAVGISTYDVGPGWWLPNAADNALAFARWALDRHVPPERVHLFLSTADANRLAQQIGDAHVSVRPATFAEVTSFALQTLPAIEAALLYMFWAGHGSMSGDGRRLLFFQDATLQTQLPFDLNAFFARMRSSSSKRIPRQLAFVDACANRYEDLSLDSTAGQVTGGAGLSSHVGIRQHFFLAADAGQQAKDGAFGTAILKALADASGARPAEWPVDQDAIVAAVRPLFSGARQHPVQLVWTTAAGDELGEQYAGELPGLGVVNAAAYARKMPVQAVHRLARIALSYPPLGEDTAAAAHLRDELYRGLYDAAGRTTATLGRGTPKFEVLQIVSVALQRHKEEQLATALRQLTGAAAFTRELEGIAIVRDVCDIVNRLPAQIDEVRAEYLKTISRLGNEPTRRTAATVAAMLDELYQLSDPLDPQRPVWEFLLRLAERFPTHRAPIETFIDDNEVPELVRRTLIADLLKEQLFVLSFNLVPAEGFTPGVKELRAQLLVEGTSHVKHRFDAVPVTTWRSVEEKAAEVIQQARKIVISTYLRSEDALLVEFLMPGVFVLEAAESLPVPFPRKSRLLGALHPVVVRVRERTLERDQAANLGKWEAAGKRIRRDRPGTTHWVEPAGTVPDVNACDGIVALGFRPDDDTVLDIVDKGFPFMAWLRADLPAGEWAAFVACFNAWSKDTPLRELARKVQAIRENAPVSAAGLTLLWDDPEQVRPSFQLDDVSLGGNR